VVLPTGRLGHSGEANGRLGHAGGRRRQGDAGVLDSGILTELWMLALNSDSASLGAKRALAHLGWVVNLHIRRFGAD
jgi:hypothetical protein